MCVRERKDVFAEGRWGEKKDEPIWQNHITVFHVDWVEDLSTMIKRTNGGKKGKAVRM